MVRENRGSGVIRPWITPIHQNVKLAVCSRVTVSNFLLHFLVKNVYFFFQRVELYRAKTRLVIAKVIHPIPNLRERVILMNRMWNRSVERVGKYL